MKGLKNPAKVFRAGFIKGIESKGKGRGAVLWVLLAIELAVVCAVFYFHKGDMLAFFRKVLSCTPMGGLLVILEGIGREVIEKGGFSGVTDHLLSDYGQYIFAGLSGAGLILVMKNAQVCKMSKPVIFLHGLLQTLFSGVLLYIIADWFVIGKRGVILTVWENFHRHKAISWKSVDLWVFVAMVLLITYLLVLAISSMAENFLYFVRNAAIVGGIAAAVLFVRRLIGSRVGSGTGGTVAEQYIVKYTKGFYGADDMIGWTIMGVILIAMVLTAMKSMNE